ncbi:MAG: hypothetical protein ACLUS6_00640 [Dysosmobacter sp.]
MMNYIAIQLAAYFIIVWEVPKGAGKIGIINQPTEGGLAAPASAGKQHLLHILVVRIADRHDVRLPDIQQARL